MPKLIKHLSDAKARAAKPKEKEYKLFDGGGLYLLITPSGGKSWYLKYRYEGKEKKVSIGPYPKISVEDARIRKAEAKKQHQSSCLLFGEWRVEGLWRLRIE